MEQTTATTGDRDGRGRFLPGHTPPAKKPKGGEGDQKPSGKPRSSLTRAQDHPAYKRLELLAKAKGIPASTRATIEKTLLEWTIPKAREADDSATLFNVSVFDSGAKRNKRLLRTLGVRGPQGEGSKQGYGDEDEYWEEQTSNLRLIGGQDSHEQIERVSWAGEGEEPETETDPPDGSPVVQGEGLG